MPANTKPGHPPIRPPQSSFSFTGPATARGVNGWLTYKPTNGSPEPVILTNHMNEGAQASQNDKWLVAPAAIG